ncbi:PepSY-associated TM helix domain-containing protein [Pigmentiphaga litoralis]|uniref:PepSY-associated TM helix domain-containing protein n=1 Tax=Pigmentiphaga litoralis TaxID=516702 RepID=UPI003B43129A
MFVVVHRWVGLVLAGFLLLAGLTGALLVWNDTLDAAMSPSLFRVTPPSDDARPMDPIDLVERVQARYPHAHVRYAPLRIEAGRTLVVYLGAGDGAATAAAAPVDTTKRDAAQVEAAQRAAVGKDVQPAANAERGAAGVAGGDGVPAEATSGHAASHSTAGLPNDQVFVDPYRGVVVGERKWGDIGQGWKNLMPFIYRLHFSLALDTIGSYVFGVIALLWTLDCFVGAYLTFPAALKTKRPDRKSWRRRWWPSWKVRWDGGPYKVNFDLHRAGGLWVWAMLFVFAWSSVAFNLSEVYDPVMKTVLAHQPEVATPVARASDSAPVMDWRHARETGRRLMAELAPAQVPAVVVLHEEALGYDASARTYRYVVRSDRDIRDHRGSTRLTFDGTAGRFVHVWLPTGTAAGDTVRTWLTSLHMAAVWGLPFDVFVTVMGIAVAMLSVTGFVIWWKKWRGRRAQAARAQSFLASPKATSSVVHDRAA